eukprot:1841360-Amphidinium_carterae.3
MRMPHKKWGPTEASTVHSLDVTNNPVTTPPSVVAIPRLRLLPAKSSPLHGVKVFGRPPRLKYLRLKALLQGDTATLLA